MLKQTKNHADVRTTERTRTSYAFQVTNRCGCDLCSAAIISRAATGTVGSRKFQLPLWIASCSVHGSPRPAVTLTLTWPRTFIMLHFATHTHDVPAFSSPAFSASPAELQELVDRLDRVSRGYSLLINVDKTKYNGERRHSVPHTHSECTTGAGRYVALPWVPDYRRWWVYDGIPYQVKQRAGHRGITAENMKKSRHTDFNKDTTNESASVAYRNVRLWKLDTQKEWKTTSWRI